MSEGTVTMDAHIMIRGKHEQALNTQETGSGVY